MINKDEDARSFLFTANPHDVQNHHGAFPNTMHVQSCDQAIADTIPLPIRDYHGCPTRFSTTSSLHLMYKFNRRDFTINMAVEILNISLKQPRMYGIIVRDGLPISNINGGSRVSHVYIRDVIVWVVPPTNAISSLEILAVNFEKEVWILVSVGFALFTFAWYVLEKFKRSFGEIVLKTFGITLSGSTNRITNSSRLRFLIVCYIIYSVHIQTAYVSNLMRLITTPPRSQPISSIKELLEAEIPICWESTAVTVRTVHKLLSHGKIFSKMKLRTCPIRDEDPRVLLESWSAHPNFSIVIPLKTLHAHALSLRLPNYFIDNHFVPPLMQTFISKRSSFIIDSLNIVIDRLTESGLYDKLDKDRESYVDSKRRELPQEEEVVALSLQHLNGIFIVYSFGLVLSVVAYIGELIAHRF
ncbi:uncharacterized protein LOC116180773 [Photinus pyralis]|uniref:uncharacterized protein LOC116180773 n=1 Tax=Photinus pyralis TaxID=7054 RepID=UPI00126707C5|nr:uncharacterized protein LOC116180773 [Photinus pyralis]